VVDTARDCHQKRNQDELHLVLSTEVGVPGVGGHRAASRVEWEDTLRDVEHATTLLLNTAVKIVLATESTSRTAQHHTARLTVAGAAGRNGRGPMYRVEKERSIGVESATILHHSTVANHALRMLSKARDTSDQFAQPMEGGAVGATGQNQVQLVDPMATSRERGSATIHLQRTTEETVMDLTSKRRRFLCHDALWTVDGTRGASGRRAV
jgi:hypothetical protein